MIEHGTYRAYAREKCRCDICRDYQNTRVSKNRADRLASGRISHGTRSGYDAGCRCSGCKRLRSKIGRAQTTTIVLSRGEHNHAEKKIQSYGKCPLCDNYLTRMYG